MRRDRELWSAGGTEVALTIHVTHLPSEATSLRLFSLVGTHGHLFFSQDGAHCLEEGRGVCHFGEARLACHLFLASKTQQDPVVQ